MLDKLFFKAFNGCVMGMSRRTVRTAHPPMNISEAIGIFLRVFLNYTAAGDFKKYMSSIHGFPGGQRNESTPAGALGSRHFEYFSAARAAGLLNL